MYSFDKETILQVAKSQNSKKLLDDVERLLEEDQLMEAREMVFYHAECTLALCEMRCEAARRKLGITDAEREATISDHEREMWKKEMARNHDLG